MGTVRSVVAVHIVHAENSQSMLKEIERALVTRLGKHVLFRNKPQDADMVFRVHIIGKHRVLRKVGDRQHGN